MSNTIKKDASIDHEKLENERFYLKQMISYIDIALDGLLLAETMIVDKKDNHYSKILSLSERSLISSLGIIKELHQHEYIQNLVDNTIDNFVFHKNTKPF